jgi:hypothetical protein
MAIPLISQTAETFLNLRRYPARLTVDQVCALLGCKDYDIPILTKARILEPLGNPAPSAPKLYFAADVVALAEDRGRMEKAHKVISRHWAQKNQKARGSKCGNTKDEPNTALTND